MNRYPKEKIYLGLIVLLGLWLRLWGIDWGLPYQYQTEEYKVIKYALRMGGGDLNPHFFEYPSLYLYFMLSIYGGYYFLGRIFGTFSSVQDFAHLFVQDPTSFYLIGRILESLFGIGIIILTYIIGKKIFSRKVGLYAAFFIAVLPIFVYKGHKTKGDMAATFLVLSFFLTCWNLFNSGEKKWYFFAGILLGLALSTKYYLLPFGICLPTAHLLGRRWKRNKELVISFIFVPLFFFLGTPYSILSFTEFRSEIASISKNVLEGEYSQSLHYIQNLFIALKNFLKMSDSHTYNPIGIFSFFGLGMMFWKREKVRWLIILPIISFLLIVAKSSTPAAGYLTPTFPLLAVSSGFFITGISNASFRKVTKTFYFLLIGISILESVKISYSYSLKDTRTITKEWIEENIPAKSKILLDVLPFSPPLEMSENQLRKFYEIALKLNHYKKDYFRLKLEVFNPKIVSYDLFVVKRSVREIGEFIAGKVEEVQKTQDLVEVDGKGADMETIRKVGIDYVITNSWSENTTRIRNFNQELSMKATLLKTFAPQTQFHPGPKIKIYQVK